MEQEDTVIYVLQHFSLFIFITKNSLKPTVIVKTLFWEGYDSLCSKFLHFRCLFRPEASRDEPRWRSMRWEHNIKVDAEEIRCEVGDWISCFKIRSITGVCEYSFQLLNSLETEEICTSCATINFSVETLGHVLVS